MKNPPLGVCFRATVDRIVDADTIDVVAHLPVRIRLLDCDAPELLKLTEREAGQAALRYVQRTIPEGSEVVVQVPTEAAGSLMDVMTFGRTLGHVWTKNQADHSLSELLVMSGHAVPMESGR